MLLLSLYLVLTKWLFKNRLRADENTRALIREQIAGLGPMSASEKRVLIVFVSTAFLWITKDLINATGWIALDDTIIALIGGLSLFAIPSGAKNNTGVNRKLLVWSDTSKMAWGIIILFGGGISLAAALEKTGVIQSLGIWIAGMGSSGGIALIFMVALISIFVSEFMSNIAQVIVFSPVIAGIADAMGINPLLLGVPMTLAASCASMMPMGTPPNAIVFGSGHVKLNQMVKTGFVMNIVCLILITLFCYFVIPLIVPAVK